MKQQHFFAGCLLVCLASFTAVTPATAQSLNLTPVFSDAEKQTQVLLAEVPKAMDAAQPKLLFPRTVEKGHLKLVSATDWTSGFPSGVLWFLYDYTGKKEWRTAAEQQTVLMEKEQWNKTTHDMGFKMYCSYGSGYRLTKDPAYKEVLLQSARTLCTRFNPTIGCIRSWDNRKWAFPVIIDNMMNLELLFAATRLSGDSSFYRIAVSHANTTLKNHFRADHSSYHVVDYDSATGGVISRGTHQGYADESAWARGQAWGLYGFTMCYRETKNKAYLQQAEAIAAFILNHPNLPADKVPYWDFNDPAIPAVPRDASAAAVMASALLELSDYSMHKKEYRQAATAILTSLTNQYRSRVGENYGFILLHSTGHKPANSEIDVPLNYADYYYLEALLRYKGNRNK
jgi:hypothetical protein